MKNMLIVAAALVSAVTLSFTLSRKPKAEMATALKLADTANGVVRIMIDNPGQERLEGLHLYYHDSVGRGKMPGFGGTEVQLLLNKPTMLINGDPKQTPFVVYPGETIHLRYTKTDSLQFIIPGNEQRTRELDFFRQLVRKTGNVYCTPWTVPPYQQKVTTMAALHQHESTINELKNNRLRFLYNYAAIYPLMSSGFTSIAAHSIKSAAIQDSLMLYFYNRPLLTQQGNYQAMVIAKLQAVEALGFMPYPLYYSACTNVMLMGMGDAPYGPLAPDTATVARRFNYIQKNFTGKIRTFLWSGTLYSAIYDGLPVAKAALQTFYTQSGDAGYNELIARTVKNAESVTSFKPGTNQLMGRDGKTVQNLDLVMAKYKNKVVLLDFWASWCGPCRSEMPGSLQLQKQYAGKRVAFVTLSTDRNLSDWQKAAREERLNPADSYLLLNADRSPLVKQYNINSIPRYMLVGKNGKIINADAPRPSEPKLKQLIDQNL